MLEPSNKIQVGDFIDAQDSRGFWYEATVMEVNEEAIKVHFFGWSSKSDQFIPHSERVRISEDNKTETKISSLWSKTPRWRENIAVGDLVEIRESSSQVDSPKWSKGVVKRIGCENNDTQNITGGAALEILHINDKGDKIPLLLHHRTEQVLVKVEQETKGRSTLGREDRAPIYTSTVHIACSPHLRWVHLYGEEICRWNTHLPHNHWDQANSKHADSDKSFVTKSQIRGASSVKGSVGLRNLGNTCYMNAILQSLNQIKRLTSYFIKGDYLKDINKTNPLGTGGSLALAYASLIKQLWMGEYLPVSPADLKLTVAKFASQFNNSYQHDSHEFLSFLLDGLHEDLNRIKDKPHIEAVEGLGMDYDKAAVKSWKNYLLRNDSIFVDHCHGMQKSHLTCPLCGKQSIKFDVYSSLSLNLECIKAPKTLSECFNKFTEGEQLDPANAWYCPKCKKHVCANKTIQIWTTPDILILHLKRFAFKRDKSKKQGHVRTKIQDVIHFPVDDLDLKPFVCGPMDPTTPPIYKLLGVVEHSGLTVNVGHYTATVRNMSDHKWYRFNDDHVEVTTAENAISGNAYILFYERSHGSNKWAGMDTFIESFGQPLVDSDGFTVVSSKKHRKKAI